jgi:CHAT domain-containing protein
LRSPGAQSVAKLSLADIAEMSLPNLRLVVLSSCWTASTAVLPGNQLVCLPQAFLDAGASEVICPIWQVDDELGFQLMKELYPQLLRGSAATTLATTQATWAVSTNRRHRMPFAWSAFRVFAGGTPARARGAGVRRGQTDSGAGRSPQ